LAEAEQLVARFELQRCDDRVEALGRVLDKGPVLSPAAEKSGDLPDRLPDQARQGVAEEGRPVRFHLAAEIVSRLQHDARRRAETAMIEVRHTLGEAEIAAPGATEFRKVHLGTIRPASLQNGG
jgi:hypothetical protein